MKNPIGLGSSRAPRVQGETRRSAGVRDRAAGAQAVTRHYHTLDGVRGVAALLVVAMHSKGFLQPLAFPRAYLAVDLFFALSGLVIAHAYGSRLSAGLGTGRFMLMRVIRLYPLYLAGTALGIAYFCVTTRFGAKLDLPPGTVIAAIGASLVMMPSVIAIEPRHWLTPFNIAAWSLVFELGANLILVLIWRQLGNRLLAAIIVLSAIVLVMQTLAHGNADVGGDAATALLGIARTAFSFFAGVAIHRLRPSRTWRTRWAFLLPLAIAGLVTVGRSASAWYDLGCFLLLFPAMIYVGAIIEPRSTRGYATLGLISYAIYALHSPILPVTANLFKLVHTTPVALAPVGGLVLLCIMASTAYAADRLYDIPVRRWLAERIKTRRSSLTIVESGVAD